MNGARIGITADRRAAEQASLVRALGGVPVHGPALRADAPRHPEPVLAELEPALAGPLAAAAFLTGVGARLLIAAADAGGRGHDLRAALAGAWVAARGPKPRAALRAAGVRVDRVVDPPHAAAVVAALAGRGVAGRRVLVQGFGPPPDEVAGPLRAIGAAVTAVSPYGAGPPADPEPARILARRARDGDLDALTFTSAQAARQFAALAADAGVTAPALAASGCLVAAVGPVTAEALRAAGLPVHVEPSPPRMGALYRALAEALRGRRPVRSARAGGAR